MVAVQTSRHEREEAEKAIAQLKAEVSALERRLVDMRATEVERMNEVNRTCEEMVSPCKPRIPLCYAWHCMVCDFMVCDCMV